MKYIITGFHAIEERLKQATERHTDVSSFKLFYSKPGPRIKKILSAAQVLSVPCNQVTKQELDSMVRSLPASIQDHRGIVLSYEGEAQSQHNMIDLSQWIIEHKDSTEPLTVIILDNVTDPHNVGAIIRSCDQFGAALVVIPERHGANDIAGSEIIARSSAGSAAWVPVSIVKNLVRATQQLKEAGFWVYGADAGGTNVTQLSFSNHSAVIMGSEGTGIGRLLEEQCDSIVSIPTCGKIDSLNVSVAAGVLLYELFRQRSSTNE
ncbi:MAG: 23S rRNA (guanosine(2251)-2'-O)-methyltransferase RlmB [Treponema sp.]|nr:23S rRNA (guanosine(2251)-2'-O)-methyltransferase RlmB [Treponema sp.]